MKDTFVLCKDRINYTMEMSVEDKASLLDVIFKYQNGMDIGDTPYVVKIVFSHMKGFFEKQQEKYEKIIERNQKNGEKGGRPTEKKHKKPSGLSTNPKKPKETLTDTDTVILPTDVGNNISNDIGEDSIINTSILNNTETGQKKEKYGSEEVNEIMEIIKKFNDGVVNGSDGKQRQFAHNLIKKLKHVKSVEEGAYTRQAILEMILGIIKDDQYFGTKIGSPELIFYNLASLMNACRKKLKTGTRQF